MLRLGVDGQLELVRTAPPEDPDRLRRTAATMQAAAGAGAVEVVAMADDGERVELVLAFAGRSPSAPVDPPEVARIGAAVAANLADLHLRAISHGSIAPDHVLVDADGAVRLCGFGSAADGTPADDALALGSMLRALLDPDDRSDLAEAIRATADRCLTDPDARPSMASIAAALASMGGPRKTLAAVSRPPRRRPWLVIAAVAVAAVLVLARAAWSGPRPRQSGKSSTATAEATTTSTTTSAASAAHVAAATRVWPRSPAATIAAEGATWTWGTVDDRHLIGDWDCDGVATPALVQPSGAVWLIDSWPAEGRAVARYVTTVDGVVDASVEHGPTCDAIVLVTADREVRPSLIVRA